MVFYILMAVPVCVFVVSALAAVLCAFAKEIEAMFGSILFGAVFTAVLSIPAIVIWSGHSEDLSVISTYSEVVKVYQERRDRLTATMDSFNYPSTNSSILLNADSPIKSIVEQLSKTESELAEAESKIAKAKVSIEARRLGPNSGVIAMVGDYK